MGLWDINNAYFKYSIWASGIATNFTKMEVRGTLRVNMGKLSILRGTPVEIFHF